MPAPPTRISDLQQKVWRGSIPLEIRLAPSDCRSYDDSDPYLVQPPRLSYLAFLLPMVYAFFASSLIKPDVSPNEAWLSFEGVPLKWHYALGLLYDLYSGAEPTSLEKGGSEDAAASQTAPEATSSEVPIPWRLTVHFTDYPGEQLIQLDADGRALLDSYINAVKEADFIRNGNARTVMSLSKEDSDSLWRAVKTHDLPLFNTINNKLLSPPGQELRHVPLKIYLPTGPANTTASDTIAEEEPATRVGHIRVVQTLVSLQQTSTKHPQTLGTALNAILPAIFPSRRNPLLAQPVLHGAVVPLAADVESLCRAAAYTDGFLHVAVVMLG